MRLSVHVHIRLFAEESQSSEIIGANGTTDLGELGFNANIG